MKLRLPILLVAFIAFSPAYSADWTITDNATVSENKVVDGKIIFDVPKGAPKVLTINAGISLTANGYTANENVTGGVTTVDIEGNFTLTGGAEQEFVLVNKGYGYGPAEGVTNLQTWSVKTGGELVSENMVMTLAKDGNVTFNLLGGSAKLLGVDFSKNKSDKAQTVNLDSGALNIGASGIIAGTGVYNALNLGAGTVGAWANWSSTAGMTLGYSAAGTEGVIKTTFDTNYGNTTGEGYSITLSGALVDTSLTKKGGIIKTGAGTLTLTHEANTFTGGTELVQGTLLVKSAASLGALGSRALMVTGDSTFGYTETHAYDLDALSIKGGTSLTLSNVTDGVSIAGSQSISVTSAGVATIKDDITFNGGNVHFNGQGTLESTGTITFGTTPTILNFTNPVVGDYTLFSGSSVILGYSGEEMEVLMGKQFALLGISARYVTWNVTGNSISFTLSSTSQEGASLTWKGQSGIWGNRAETQWNALSGDDLFWNGDKVTFNGGVAGAARTQDITVSGLVSTASMEFVGAETTYNFIGGGSIICAGGIYISGPFIGNTSGTTINIKGDTSLTIARYRGADTANGAATKATNYVNIGGETAGALVVTGAGADDFVLSVTGHGNGDDNKSVMTVLSQGSVTAESTVLKMDKDGSARFSVEGGTAKLLGVHMGEASNKKSELRLTGAGLLNIGASGITNFNVTQDSVNLGAGTVGAWETWATSANINLGYAAPGVEGTVSTIFDTAKGANSNGYTITLSGVLADYSGTQKGALVKNGAGTLVLSGENTYSGGTTLNAGTLQVNNAAALGSGSLTINGGDFVNASNAKMTLSQDVVIAVDTSLKFSGASSSLSIIGNLSAAGKVVTQSGGNLTLGTTVLGKTQSMGTLINHTGDLTVNGAISLAEYKGTNGSWLAKTLTIEEGADMRVSGKMYMRYQENGETTVNMTGGKLTVEGELILARDGTTTWNLSGGVANINKINLDCEWDGASKVRSINLNKGATLNIGEGGVVFQNSWTVANINLNGGVLGATANWEIADKSNLNIKLQSTEGTIINTENSLNPAEGYTVTIKSAIKDYDESTQGKLVKKGAGTLDLHGANTYSGGTTINEGTVKASSATALGTGLITVSGGTLDANSQNLGNALTVTGGTVSNLIPSGNLYKEAVLKVQQNITVNNSLLQATAANAVVIDLGKQVILTNGAKLAMGVADAGNVVSATMGAVNMGDSPQGLISVETGTALTLSGTFALTIDSAGVTANPDGYSFTLISFANAEGDYATAYKAWANSEGAFDLSNFQGFTVTGSEGWALKSNDLNIIVDELRGSGTVTLVNTSIPEPSTVSLSLLALAGLMFRRRRTA